MSELKPCPFCGSEASYEFNSDWGLVVTCHKCGALMTEINYPTKQQAIEAWNKRDNFKVPDGYIVLPATKLDKPKPVIFNTDNGIESRYDFSEAVRKYSEYIANQTDYEILTKSLNRAGWFKERTCKNLATRKDDFACSECNYEVVGCMVDDFGSFDNPLCFSYCPNCGAKVVE